MKINILREINKVQREYVGDKETPLGRMVKNDLFTCLQMFLVALSPTAIK